jgi:hypothetical protein
MSFDTLETVELDISAKEYFVAVAGVEQSSYSYISAMGGGELSGRAVLNRHLAGDFADGLNILRACQDLFGTDQWEPLAATALSSWSASYQAASEAVRLEEILSYQWMDALEGLDRLLAALGLPPSTALASSAAFGEARHVTEFGGTMIRGISIRFEELPLVMGDGTDFLGVWDRANPGTPIARFPPTSEGRLARDAFFVTHCFPVQSPEFGDSWRVPSSGPFPVVLNGSRRTRLENERYLLGWGTDFLGIWDRANPKAPVVTFPETEEGNIAAWEEWLRLREG